MANNRKAEKRWDIEDWPKKYKGKGKLITHRKERRENKKLIEEELEKFKNK